MKKEEFMKLGLDEETAKKCEVASVEELKGFIPKTRFDEVNNEKKKLELDVRDRDSQLETLKNSTGDVEEMKNQIKTLQAENKKKDETHAAEIKQMKVDVAIDSALSSAKAKNKIAVKALLKDLDKAELEEDGTVKGLSEQIQALVKAEDSKFLFDAETKNQAKLKGAKPGESGMEDGEGAVDFSKMTFDEINTYYAENPDASI